MNPPVCKAVVSAATILLVSSHAVGQEQPPGPEAAIQGCYVGSLFGAILPEPADSTLQLPLAALVQMCADGAGAAQVEAVQDIGGACIVEISGDATFSVAPSGLGTATASLQTDTVSEGCNLLVPPPAVGETADFEIRFGVQEDGCLQLIGTGLVPEGGLPVGIVTRGEACPQAAADEEAPSPAEAG
jgi:hypothetical protein